MSIIRNAFHVLNVAPIVQDTYSAYKEGRNVPGALLKSTFSNMWPTIVAAGLTGGAHTIATTFLYAAQSIPALTTAVYGAYNARVDLVRTSTQPFSHQTEHSDFCMMAQQRGLQSISGSRSLIGSEAGLLAQRYSRR